MEGISIGEQDTEWYIGINHKVRSWGCVTGWHYNADPLYRVDPDMTFLDKETHLGPKCLIEW